MERLKHYIEDLEAEGDDHYWVRSRPFVLDAQKLPESSDYYDEHDTLNQS